MKKIDTDSLSEIEIFHLVLDGVLPKYPNGIWSPPFGIDYATNILKYVIEDILKWNEDDILEKYDIYLFRKYKLNGMIAQVFNSSPFEALDAVYPNKFKRWQFYRARGCWKNGSDDDIIKAVKEIYEEEFGIKNVDDLYKIKNHRDIIMNYGLNGIIHARKISYHELLKMVYPEIEEEKFDGRSGKSFYDFEDAIILLRNIFKEKGMTHEDITNLTADSLNEYNLYGLFVIKYKMSIYEVIDLVYPNEYKAWEFKKIKNGFWKNPDNIRDAVTWLIEEKLHLDTHNTIRICKSDFLKHNLGSLIVYSDMNHIGLKNLIKSVYNNCEVIFKTSRVY